MHPNLPPLYCRPIPMDPPYTSSIPVTNPTATSFVPTASPYTLESTSFHSHAPTATHHPYSNISLTVPSLTTSPPAYRIPAPTTPANVATVPGQINYSRTYTAQQLGLLNPTLPATTLGPAPVLTVPPTGIAAGTVPRYQFDRCVNECKNWQVKYNELYLKYMSLLKEKSNVGGGVSGSESYELQRLRQENFELEQKLIMTQNSERVLNENIEHYIVQLVNKYREAAIKESNLLMDRFRLQCRQETRPNN